MKGAMPASRERETVMLIFGSNADERLRGGGDDDFIFGFGGNDVIIGRRGDDFLFGNDGDDFIRGGGGDDLLAGGAGIDELRGGGGRDILAGGLGADILTGGGGRDTFFFGQDPFAEADVSAEGRQIIGDEDTITDFQFNRDTYSFAGTGFDVENKVNFVSLDANKAKKGDIADGTNVVVLLNSDNDGDPETPFLAGTAANQIAEIVTTDGAGFFVYFNSNLQLNRLVYSENLNDATADLKIISRQDDLLGQDAIDALARFDADNFDFSLVVQDDEYQADAYDYDDRDDRFEAYSNEQAVADYVEDLAEAPVVPEADYYLFG